MPTHTPFVELEQLQEQGARFYQDAQQRFESRRIDPMRLHVGSAVLPLEDVNRQLKYYSRLFLKTEKSANLCAAEKFATANLTPTDYSLQ